MTPSRGPVPAGRIVARVLAGTLVCALCAALGFGAGRALPVGEASKGEVAVRSVAVAPRIRTVYAPCPREELDAPVAAAEAKADALGSTGSRSGSPSRTALTRQRPTATRRDA